MDAVSSGDISDTASGKDPWKPTPDNFDEYLPWACHQLQLGIEITIINVQIGQRPNINKAKGSKQKAKPIPKLDSYVEPEDINKKKDPFKSIAAVNKSFTGRESEIKLYTIYNNEYLVQLKFDNNKSVPVTLLKIIQLILQFHSCLANITINRGVNKAVINELNNMLSLPSSSITDLCLDNTAVMDGNYDLFLQKENNLKQLSLSRCKINDEMVYKIASRLSLPLPASKTLAILNLASNTITDTGAKYIAEALRTNRQLVYLNLSDNSITDEGAIAIINDLDEFIITSAELMESRSRNIAYWKEKQELISQMMAEQPVIGRSISKRKCLKPTPMNSAARKREVLEKDMMFTKREEVFKDPFSSENIVNRDDKVHCYGNNQLAYLNLSYNNVTYLTVKKLLSVLLNQKKLNRKPKGLINIVIEGNYIPKNCPELNQIDDILQAGVQIKPTAAFRKASIQ